MSNCINKIIKVELIQLKQIIEKYIKNRAENKIPV